MNENIVREIDKAADPWGVKVLRYEIRNISPSKLIVDTMEKQMEAEREKRAEITNSEGHRQARINESQGEQQSQVLISEAQRQRRINEAKGRAKEIELVATATAKGLRRVAEAISKPGGETAVKTKLVEQYIDEFGKILQKSKVSVLPTETANLKTFFEGVGKISSHTTGGSGSSASNDKGGN
jgi:regulator of protease activity HflC (stomatin/prohibitin superfamily)